MSQDSSADIPDNHWQREWSCRGDGHVSFRPRSETAVGAYNGYDLRVPGNHQFNFSTSIKS